MSPAKSKKAKSAPRKAGKKAGKAARPAAKARTASKPAHKGKPRGKPAAAKAAKGPAGHAHCAATDPFGDVCQNLPRRPSKYCVIHSYLDR